MSLSHKIFALFFVTNILVGCVAPVAATRLIDRRDFDPQLNEIGPPVSKTNDHRFDTQAATVEEFSWTRIISLGLQLVLSFFGSDNTVMEKMDPGSPIEALTTALITYFTGSNDPKEVSAMTNQAMQLWDIIYSLYEALMTSFSQRSLGASWVDVGNAFVETIAPLLSRTAEVVY